MSKNSRPVSNAKLASKRTGVKKITNVLYDYQWFIIAACWLVVLLLGAMGFQKYYTRRGESFSFVDGLYYALGLFALKNGTVLGLNSWMLELARWFAPFIVGLTGYKTLALLYAEQFKLLKLHRIKNHTVICGVGRKGILWTKVMLARGEQVVVIEKNTTNDNLQICKELGAMVLVGDATKIELLNKTGIVRAKYLITLCGDDNTNIDIAMRARSLQGNIRHTPLTCLVHIIDSRLCALLLKHEFEHDLAGIFRLAFFNIYDAGARAILRNYPLSSPDTNLQETIPQLLLIGFNQLGQSIIGNVAQQYREKVAASERRIRITIVDQNAEQQVQYFTDIYPFIKEVCDITAYQIPYDSPRFYEGSFSYDNSGKIAITAVYICLDDDSQNIRVALFLLHHFRQQQIPVIVKMAHESGISTLLQKETGSQSLNEQLHCFALYDRTCTPDTLIYGTREIIAQAIHEQYIRDAYARGETPQTNPSMVPWDQLPDSLKESSRAQTDQIGLKLHTIGYGIAPMIGWSDGIPTFTDDEIERLAKMEHERWYNERMKAGWKFCNGPKSIERKEHPDLVAWDELNNETKEKDRSPVCEMPMFLAKVGLTIYRLKDKPETKLDIQKENV